MKALVIASFLLAFLGPVGVVAGCLPQGFEGEGEGEGEEGEGEPFGTGFVDTKALTVRIEPTSGMQRFHVPIESSSLDGPFAEIVVSGATGGNFRMALGTDGSFTDDESEYFEVAAGTNGGFIVERGFDFGVLPRVGADSAVDADLELHLAVVAGASGSFGRLEPVAP